MVPVEGRPSCICGRQCSERYTSQCIGCCWEFDCQRVQSPFVKGSAILTHGRAPGPAAFRTAESKRQLDGSPNVLTSQHHEIRAKHLNSTIRRANPCECCSYCYARRVRFGFELRVLLCWIYLRWCSANCQRRLPYGPRKVSTPKTRRAGRAIDTDLSIDADLSDGLELQISVYKTCLQTIRPHRARATG
jgi:hypothetical protein